jgi:hypothetical protein
MQNTHRFVRRIVVAGAAILLVAPLLGTGPSEATTTTNHVARWRSVGCGADATGALATSVPRGWHRVTPVHALRRCAWTSPDGHHTIALQVNAPTMRASRAAARTAPGHYVENRWHRQPVWGLSGGHVWDYGRTADGTRWRHRVMGFYDMRISYTAPHGCYDRWAAAWHHARSTSWAAG